ncbi:unnamed protein product [Triticum turgidum subsp. durum]|uniref:Maltose excess protein 1-like, chloroplastic n=1 Tax=Triticum turgidum subsp. durum TaxID=4567 RepID=A0A9R1RC91_TRITD|nr:unnamed protein product [Triticum turgidum subsp. durum]
MESSEDRRFFSLYKAQKKTKTEGSEDPRFHFFDGRGQERADGGAGSRVTKEYQDWDSLTGKFAGSANVPFLLLQLPQIILNYRNLVDGNKTALYAVPWLGMLTGLLGNLALVSYFAKKRETEAVIVQTLGVISTYVVILQLAMAESMPFPQFVATSAVVGAGLVLNLLNYIGWLPETLWLLWEDFTTVGGLTVLPQVMWSTFVPVIPSSILPGIICGSLAVAAVAMARMGKLSEGGTKFVGSLSGWTATLLFMWMPVAQMWTNYLNPSNIEGLSAFSMLLSMIGNALMIPRSVFIRDLMWFTGSIWACALQGWGNLACMYWFHLRERHRGLRQQLPHGHSEGADLREVTSIISKQFKAADRSGVGSRNQGSTPAIIFW